MSVQLEATVMLAIFAVIMLLMAIYFINQE